MIQPSPIFSPLPFFFPSRLLLQEFSPLGWFQCRISLHLLLGSAVACPPLHYQIRLCPRHPLHWICRAAQVLRSAFSPTFGFFLVVSCFFCLILGLSVFGCAPVFGLPMFGVSLPSDLMGVLFVPNSIKLPSPPPSAVFRPDRVRTSIRLIVCFFRFPCICFGFLCILVFVVSLYLLCCIAFLCLFLRVFFWVFAVLPIFYVPVSSPFVHCQAFFALPT